MRWLQISDIHFNPDEDGRSTRQLRQKLPIYLKDRRVIVDEVFVTGDFRHAGKQEDTVDIAQDAVNYIKVIAASVGVLETSHIHVIPGNHDLTRLLPADELMRIRTSYNIDSGRFADTDLSNLMEQFSFFRKIVDSLHGDNSVWSNPSSPIHNYQCFDSYNILYMNTALTCGCNPERGHLLVGNEDLYLALEAIKERNPAAPIIVLAHHAAEYFSKNERETVEKLFADYPVRLYLCGDAHEIWFRETNNVLEITMGCIKQDNGVQAVFSVGEIINDAISVAAYIWDTRMSSWGRYEQFDRRINEHIARRAVSPQRLALADDWFIQQNMIQIRNLGNRYVPELHIPLEIHDITCGIARDEIFHQKFLEIADKCLIALNRHKIAEINDQLVSLQELIKAVPFNNCSKQINIQSIIEVMHNIIDALSRTERESDENGVHDNYYLRSALNASYEFEEFLDSQEVLSSNNPYMLIHGDGGIGKSHMIADIVTQRMNNGKKSILLLGQHFLGDNNPISSLPTQLQLNCSIDKIIQLLNEKGAEQGSRVFIIIDALNEGAGKAIWPNHLAGLIQRLRPYNWIGLIVTIRTQYLDQLMDDNDYLSNSLVLVEHHGLADAEYSAISKYFAHYNVPMNHIPPLNPEFENPLFLRLFCESYSADIRYEDITLDTVYSRYISNANKRIAEKYGYNNVINIVQKSIERIVTLKHDRSHFLDTETCIVAISEIAQRYNIHVDLIGAFLSEGILTQSTLYDGSEFFYITYEKLDDYVYASYLAQELNDTGADTFYEKHNNLLENLDFMQILAITLAEKCGYEIFEVFSNNREDYSVMNAFVYSLQWRSASSISEKTDNYINSCIIEYQEPYEMLLETFVMLSTKATHPYNAYRLHSHFRSYELPVRDAILVPIFDSLYTNGYSAINKLVDWALFDHDEHSINPQMILSASIMLSWFLLSPTNALRNCATRALINLGLIYPDSITHILERFADIDDPYISERLYAVAFGCAVAVDEEKLRHLAIFVYNQIFNVENVCPNILLRDYAKNLIDYAYHILGNLEIDYSKIIPPYKSVFPEVPSDEQTKQYHNNDPGSSQIWRSMQVEYSREGDPGGYGDFGRYTFQRYFHAWNNLHPMDLKNIAIKRIYELGYESELHGDYDKNAQRDRGGRTGHERIGKKYQWIAMYELAAQVSDNFTMRSPYSWKNDTERIYNCGSFEPSIRNIDPTIKLIDDKKINSRTIHETVYTLPDIEDIEWLSSYDDFPGVATFLQCGYQENQHLLLEGSYEWLGKKELGHEQYRHPTKRLWIEIKSYICHKDDWASIYGAIKDIDIMTMLPSYSNSSHGLFNKEYYWSKSYKFAQNPYYGDSGWVELLIDYEQKAGDVLLTSLEYATERDSDLIDSNRASWFKPCEELFYGLEMKYGKENSILYASDGQVICFDSKEVLNEDIGLFVNRDALISFLESKAYKIFWIIQSEKMVIGDESLLRPRVRYKRPRVSGIYHFQENHTLTGHLNLFED